MVIPLGYPPYPVGDDAPFFPIGGALHVDENGLVHPATVNGHLLVLPAGTTISGLVFGTIWGQVTGTLANQTDLQTALNLKATTASLTIHTGNVSNPHSVTALQVGLGNVTNTSDANKPVSTAQATADALVASNAATALASHTGNVSNPHNVTKTQVGLGNVDNTTDLGKPVSTAQQTALDLKANLASPIFTGVPLVPTAATITSNTQAASTGFVHAVIDALVAGAETALDTLNELAVQMRADESGVASLTTTVAGKLAKASNLSDLTDATVARTNLALGTLATQSGTFSGISSGTNTGDQTTVSGNAGTATALATARAIYGNNFDGTAALSQVIASTYGGTGNGFTKFSGPTSSEKTKTLRDATDTILELEGSYTPTGTWTSLTLVTPTLGTPASGVVTNLTGTASININGTVGATTPAAGTFTTLVAGSTTSLLLGTAGSAVGNIGFRNATSGTVTLAPPTGALGTYTITLPNAASTMPIFGQQMTFAGPTVGRIVTLPDANFTAARTDAANTFTGVQTFNTALAVASGGTGDTGTAWSSYTPTITSGTGTLTTANATCRYKTIGKTVFVQLDCAITTNGTGASYVKVTLPVTAVSAFSLAGREVNVTGKTVLAYADGVNNTYVSIFNYDNTYPGGSGYRIVVSGSYESA